MPRQGEDSAQGTVQCWADLGPAGCPLPALSRHWASDIQPSLHLCPGFPSLWGSPRGSSFLDNAKRHGPVRRQTRERALSCLSKERKPGCCSQGSRHLARPASSSAHLAKDIRTRTYTKSRTGRWRTLGHETQRGRGLSKVRGVRARCRSPSQGLSSGQHRDGQGNHQLIRKCLQLSISLHTWGV